MVLCLYNDRYQIPAKMKYTLLKLLFAVLLISCGKDDPAPPAETTRDFKMGFTTWSYGPNLVDVNNTYAFIENNADIYAEHIDSNIPWNAWINDEPLPTEFTNEIIGRVNRKIPGKELLLSVSNLTTSRDELAFDFDGTTPSYTNMDDENIKNAYYKHINYLVDQFNPDYLVIAIEVNELRLHSPEKWSGYENLMNDVKSRVKQAYPGLRISESISIHNIYESEIDDAQAYVSDVMNHVNQNDFMAISFYPFLKNLSSASEFQGAFDFIHSNTTLPIAFVESAHIAEDLIIPNFNVSIDGNETGQNEYLETLFENAQSHNYEFIIWWAHRDFDALWETFPDEVRDLGQIWRDTGLLDENGVERSSYSTWVSKFGE